MELESYQEKKCQLRETLVDMSCGRKTSQDSWSKIDLEDPPANYSQFPFKEWSGQRQWFAGALHERLPHSHAGSFLEIARLLLQRLSTGTLHALHEKQNKLSTKKD